VHPVRVGISGWAYPRWRGDFYPPGLRQRDELAYAAERMTSIEVNASFYSLQRPTSYAAWRAAAPDDFVYAVKGGRFITHMKKLVGVETALANFFASGVLALGPALGPVLWQLPKRLVYDERRMSDFFALLPRTAGEAAELARRHDAKLSPDRALTETDDVDRPLRHVLEFRHRSFCEESALDLLRRHGRPVARGRRRHQPGRLRAAARRHRALRQRLQPRGARALGGALPGVGRGARRLRLLRQRRPRPRPARRHRTHRAAARDLTGSSRRHDVRACGAPGRYCSGPTRRGRPRGTSPTRRSSG
jgi:uncharacterized protein YecE (DUF72 family)